MLVDSHAHLDDPRFDTDRPGVLQRAWDAGVRRILTIGIGQGPEDMGCGIPIAESCSWIVTSVGVHPHEAAKVEERHYTQMRELAAHPKVVGIGETGLDYYYSHSSPEIQREVFDRQASLAGELGLPLIIHTRDADGDTESILSGHPSVRGVIHCFTSGRRLADFALERGFMISFSGIVTFRNAHPILEIARSVPSDRILVETDSPYLAPVPHRGQRNEPGFVADTARFLAEARGVSVEQIALETSANFARLFSLPETS
jgi:TatD DNase family protein